jgi:thymidylate kinase
MVFLVEGLNCSGKTFHINTLIDGETDIIYKTPWLNPLRWDANKKAFVKNINDFAIGAYETLIEMASGELTHVYWDRTFISAYIYDTISRQVYNYLTSLCLKINIKNIIFVDTDPKVCIDRLQRMRESDPKYKNYIWCDVLQKMIDIREKFLEVMNELSIKGFIIQTVKGE